MAAARLLCFLGFLDAEGVLENLILSTDERVTVFRNQVISDQKEFWGAIQVLTSFSLIRVKSEVEKKSISLHALVHYLSRARLTVENQWRWKSRVVIWLIQLSVVANADMVYFPHVRTQMQQMTELKSSPGDERKRRAVYNCLAMLQNHYRAAWQNQGAMDELHKYSEAILDVVEEDLEEDSEDQKHLSIVAMASLIEVQTATVQFISSDITYDQIILRYVLKQMTLLARRALENASNSEKKSDTSGNTARTQMSLPSEDDVKQDDLLSLHTLTTAMTQMVDVGSLVEKYSAQKDIKATQGSNAVTTSGDKASKDTLEVSEGPGQCDSSSIPSYDPVPANQKCSNETPSQLTSPVVDEQTTEKHEDINVISLSTTEPTTDSLSFRAKHISDVFLSITPPIRVQYLLACLSSLIKIYYNHHRVAEADLLTTYSALLVDSAQQPDRTSLQVSQLLIEASRLAAISDLDALLSIYLKIISIGHAIGHGNTEVWPVSLDYAIIMNKLRRPAEAERVITQILHSKEVAQPIDPNKSDQDLARDLQTAYVWLKKSLSTSQRLQGHLAQSLQILHVTLQTTYAVFGTNSLSYCHAALLLHRFHSYHDPHPGEAAKYKQIFSTVFENLYCGGGGGEPACSIEGLKMGVILWAQGALEETVEVFDAFTRLSERIAGESDGVSRKARKAGAIARGEWEVCRQERKGEVLKFGTIMFPRQVDGFALLLQD